MSDLQASVFLAGEQIGELKQVGADLTFRFLESYLTDLHRPTLGTYFNAHLHTDFVGTVPAPTWFNHLLPEGQLKKLIERTHHRTSMSKLDLLLALGRDLPGAVEIIKADETTPYTPARASATALGAPGSDAPAANPLRFSLAGLNLKFSGTNLGDRFVAGATDAHGRASILKLPDSRFPHLPVNEALTMRLAAAAGIDVPRVDLVHRENIRHVAEHNFAGEDWGYVIERFDRTPGGRVHIEDFLQVRGQPLSDAAKYSGNQQTLFNIVRSYTGEDDYNESIRRFVFNCLVGNADAHWKNWSFIYHDRISPRLAPAYDLVAVGYYADTTYGPGLNVDTDLALPLNKAKSVEKCSARQLHAISGPRFLNDPDFADRVLYETRRIKAVIAEAEPEHPLEEPILRYIQRVAAPALQWE